MTYNTDYPMTLRLYTNRLYTQHDANHDGIPDGPNYDFIDWPDNPGAWQNIEFYYDGTQNISLGYGKTYTLIDGVKRFEYDDLYSEIPYEMLFYFGFRAPYQEDYVNHKFSMGQIYMDNTQARVLICDVNTWSDTTHKHCEIQPPFEYWNKQKIQIHANQGSFGDGDTAYIYIITADGNVNAQGYKVVWKGLPPTYDQPNSCNDYDGGFNFVTPGCVTGYQDGQLYEYCDTCGNYGVNEWYCNGTTPMNNSFACTYPDGSMAPCINNACIDDSCSDTDAGNDTATQGLISGYDDGSTYTTADRCIRAGPTPLRTIEEQYCDGYDGNNYREACDTFCWQGECVDEVIEPAIPCSDTDGGINYDERGTVSGVWFHATAPDGEIINNSQDSCWNNHLDEWYCDENGFLAKSYTTCDLCIDGACVENSTGIYHWSECMNRYEQSCEDYCASLGEVCGDECYRPAYDDYYAYAQFWTPAGCYNEDWGSAPSNNGNCQTLDDQDLTRSRCCCAQA